MRKILVAVVLLLAVAFILLSFSELEQILATLRHSNGWFLLGALLLEMVWLYNLAVTFRLVYRLVGLKEASHHLMLVVAAANFVNVVAPSAGIGGIAVFIDDAKQRNHSTGRVTVVGALTVLLDYASLICVLVLGIIVLFRRHNLHASDITASLILLAIAATMGFLFYLGYRSAAELGRALAWMARLVNRILHPFIRREYLSEARAYSYADEMAEGFAELRGKRKEFILPFLYSLNGKALLVCILMMIFGAFGTPYTAGTLVSGISIASLFVIVSPTPAGVGFVEGALTVTLTGLRVQWEAATLIALTYRAVTFWFPLALGAVAFRLLQRKPKEETPAGSNR